MRRDDVYWTDFEPGRGGEIRKRRPAIIDSNDGANAALNRVQVVPLTSNTARMYPGEALVEVNGIRRKAMADQIRTAAKVRLSGYIRTLSSTDLRAVEQA